MEKPEVLEDLGAQPRIGPGVTAIAKWGPYPSFYRLGILFYHLNYPHPSQYLEGSGKESIGS